ncbi:iron uptake porin [Prochlorococcus sp. MIT 1341]|uniref:iron uptake porin n=1 Tax=Prochlorococcus sp. MIT 1341 TaxID=3096221 RepID=UPI002A76048D|nr:iron uptake porin [Prochlorococcus sp. MIT 1341]
MKLFQQLLVAPAALGLMAPMAAQAADLNIDGVSDYSAAGEQVTSVSQFSDVYPTDWAYQALSSLTERYGCVAGYPGGTFGGNRSITRYEAAALLNACLDRVTEVSDDVKRLLSEFGPELAVLKGRVDGIEARVGDMAAGQFSTTTKLKGKAIMSLGSTAYQIDGQKGDLASRDDGTSFNYIFQMDLNTSFTGEDLLYTRLKTGNYSTSAFGGKTTAYVPQAYLEWANSNEDTLKVDKIWYQFPYAEQFTFYVGPKIENYYMLDSAPSVYKPILKAFKLGGNYGTYGASTGAGFGVSWNQQVDDPMQARFSASTGYTAESGKGSDPSSGGMFTKESDSIWLSKVSYGNPQWQVSVAYALKGQEATTGFGTHDGDAGVYDCDQSAAGASNCESTADSYAFRAFWQPSESGLIPSFSVGYDITKYNLPSSAAAGTREESQGWFVGMNWKDAFVDGNKLGFAFGALNHITEYKGTLTDDGGNTYRSDDDSNLAMELYYDIKVSDNITVTPAVFYLDNPFGGATGKNTYGTRGDVVGGDDTDNFDLVGAIVKTQFKF